MTKSYSGLVNLNGNVLCAVDLETTGTRAGYHEPIQIACVPLNSDIQPLEGVRPFYSTIKPYYPERQDKRAGYVHGLKLEDLLLHAPEPGKVADLLLEWYESIDLPMYKNLVPLACNWAFEHKFLFAWLGEDLMQQIFHYHARDIMLDAIYENDRAAFRGETPVYTKVGLKALCLKFKVTNHGPHDALCDAMAEAEVYRCMLRRELYDTQ